ncbi:MAG: DHH family phosphoesterase [Nitrososphaerota archaeon]|nr:DHH family phosphoesterase [Nitrososphaerota archaeon]
MAGSSIVVSHRKDADGLTSAALIRFMTGADVVLTDYSDMVETLASVSTAKNYYICDLGSNQNTFQSFLKQLRRLSARGAVHYIDHHPILEDYAKSLRDSGVDVTHSVDECSAVLIYKKYQDMLSVSHHMKILACCGAITDYMDTRPFARSLISSFDRQFLMYEATVLSFTISEIGRGSSEGNSKLVELAKSLAGGLMPHEIEGAYEFSRIHAESSEQLIDLAKTKGKRMRNFAYYLTEESATGNVANFLIGAFDVQVGMAMKEEEPGFYEISLRSTEDSNHDLGKIIGRIAVYLNASGGGHPHASGARIRQEQLQKFLELLDEELSRPA